MFGNTLSGCWDVGGTIELGTRLSKQDLDKLKSTGHVVNCLGRYGRVESVMVMLRSS